VSLAPGATASAADLIAFSRDRLGRHKHPREVRIVPAVPLTSVGKTDRKALRRLSAQPDPH
jgi:long-chain acyl-CoA synthetase